MQADVQAPLPAIDALDDLELQPGAPEPFHYDWETYAARAAARERHIRRALAGVAD
jgi:hypothetical protein